MDQETMDALEARARAALVTMTHVCGRAEVSYTTWYRARLGESKLRLKTIRRLDDTLSAIERERAAA